MSANDFKTQLERCQDQRAVERLLQGWHAVKGSAAEFAALRGEVIRKVDSFKK